MHVTFEQSPNVAWDTKASHLVDHQHHLFMLVNPTPYLCGLDSMDRNVPLIIMGADVMQLYI